VRFKELTLIISKPRVVLLFPSVFELLYKFSKRFQFSWLNKFKFIDEIDEMFEAGVQVVFTAKRHYMSKMGMIDMRIYPKKPFEYN